MNRLLLTALAGSVLLGSAFPQTPDVDAKAWDAHRKTRVLYAGFSGGSREKVFEPFLKQWFDTVGVINLEQISVATAADYDVVIADWCSQYGNDGYQKREDSLFSPGVKLGDDFTKPVIAMDYVASALRSRHKLDWL